jgi:RND family efflux transporter MFP subunit
LAVTCRNRGAAACSPAIGVTLALLVALIMVLRGGSTRMHAPAGRALRRQLLRRRHSRPCRSRAASLPTALSYAWQEIVVGPEVGGYRVARVNVEVGDHVRKGQELVQLSKICWRRMSRRSAPIWSRRRRRSRMRSRRIVVATSLSGSGAVVAIGSRQVRSEELAAKARVEVSKAELQGSDLRLRHTRVTAPDDGVISARSVNVGQVAQVGTEMLRLLRKGRVEWRAEIPESRIREIRVGQNVKLTTADGAQLDGKVRTIAPTIESSTRAGLVYVDIPSTVPLHVPGMFARGEILLGQSSASMAPLSSVVTQDGYTVRVRRQ